MKKLTQRSIMAILLSTVMVIGISAQNPNGKGFGQGQKMGINTQKCQLQNFLDLTEDQVTKLDALRLDHQKEMLNFRNQMGELAAQKRTIMSAYPIDTKAADKLTDEKTALMNKMMKAQTAHQASVKKVLTEEQALKFDQMKMRRGHGKKGAGKGQFTRGGHGKCGYDHAGRGNRHRGGGYGRN